MSRFNEFYYDEEDVNEKSNGNTGESVGNSNRSKEQRVILSMLEHATRTENTGEKYCKACGVETHREHHENCWLKPAWDLVNSKDGAKEQGPCAHKIDSKKHEQEDSNLVAFAKREFLVLGCKKIEEEEEGPNKRIKQDVIELLNIFSKQGHSGFSAPCCLDIFNKLARFEPLSPLTGKEAEWNEIGDNYYQNNRCARVFKRDDVAYDSEGRIFRDFTGCYTNINSRVEITFPYTPKREYIDMDIKVIGKKL